MLHIYICLIDAWIIIFINAKYFYEKTLNAARIQIYIILTCRVQNETGNISSTKN